MEEGLVPNTAHNTKLQPDEDKPVPTTLAIHLEGTNTEKIKRMQLAAQWHTDSP